MEKNYSKSYNRLNLDTHGFKLAGKVSGQITTFIGELKKIVIGEMIDASIDVEKIEKHLDSLKQTERNTNAEIKSIESNISLIVKEEIPSKKSKIERLKIEIEDIQNGKTEYSSFDSTKFNLNLIFLVLLSLFLFIFYASAFEGAAYRQINCDNEIKIVQALFNDALFDFQLYTKGAYFFIFLFPFVFYAFGFALHIVMEDKKMKALKVTVLILITGIGDVIIAFLIHEKFNACKSMFDKVEFYKDLNFYLVIILGFVQFIMWSLLLNSLLLEKAKKDVLGGPINKIKEFELEIEKFEENRMSKLKEIDELKRKIDELSNDIEKAKPDKNSIKHSLLQFKQGWFRWLSNINDKDLETETEEKYNLFMESNEMV